MSAPITASEVETTPGGLVRTTLRSRTADLSNPADPLSFTTLTDTTTINGDTFTTVFDRATRTQVSTSPLGRQVFTVLDAHGRTIESSVAGLLPTLFSYDAQGRLADDAGDARVDCSLFGEHLRC